MNKTNEAKITMQQAMSEISRFYLMLSQGEKGHHVLFSPEMIHMTFEKDASELSKLFHENLDEINRVLNQGLIFKSLEEKRTMIEALPQDVQRALVYGYFQLIEGHRTAKPTLH